MGVQIAEAVRLTLIGMGVVFSSLVVLYLVMVLIARLIGPHAKAGDVAAAPAAEPKAEPKAAQEHGIDPEVVAAITAAVRATVGPGARLRRIRVAGGRASAEPAAWALAGRQWQMARNADGPRKMQGGR